MTYCVFDVETTYSEHFKRKGNPFVEANELVCLAYKTNSMTEPTVSRKAIPKELFQCDVLIGHNIKFDLLWLMRYAKKPFLNWLRKGGKIWDTMLCEYMVHGHLKIGYSLDKTALRYNGILKDDRIKTMWKAGIQTKDIPHEILDEYVKADVVNTYKIAVGQIKKIKQLGMMPIIEEHMAGILYTLICEHNGAKVDLSIADSIRKELDIEQKQYADSLKSIVEGQVGLDNYEHVNLKSVDHLSALLYGGKIKAIKRLPKKDADGNEQYYKSGAKKGQLVTTFQQTYIHCKGCGMKAKDELKSKKEGYYKTGFRVLIDNKSKIKLIDALLNYRRVTKLLSTYVSEIGGSVVSLTHPDGHVHPSFNHCVTSTGRLSCTAPNLQNIEKKSPLKRIFTSRFENGKIVQFDFSQLELKTLGYLTQDEALLSDIWSNVDGYIKTMAEVEGLAYDDVYDKAVNQQLPEWKTKRNIFKSVVLGMNYGMGKFKTAYMLDLDLEFVEEIYKARNTAYPQVNEFNSRVLEIIKNNIVDKSICKDYNLITEKGLEASIGKWQDPFKALYYLVEKDSPDFMLEKGIMKSFPPTQAKNFPQQGLASHINVIATNYMLKSILAAGWEDVIKPIAVVHDDQKYDCHPSFVEFCIELLNTMSKQLPEYLSTRFNTSFNVPLNGEISFGPNWKDLEKVN